MIRFLLRLVFWWVSFSGRAVEMPQRGGETYDPQKFADDLKRADLCAIATRHCYKHGAHVIDEILASYYVTRKPMKEKG